MICGKYVKTFAEASHALPDGMHMNADYPFMLPAIKNVDGTAMTIVESGREAMVKIVKKGDSEVAYIKQSSTFERIFRRPPHRFKLLPFKDNDTPAIGDQARRRAAPNSAPVASEASQGAAASPSVPQTITR